jgi:hypothetical protein
MSNDLHHDRMSLPAIPAVKRKAGHDIEVWHNPADKFTPEVVSLHIETPDDPWSYVDLTPTEARALAALLINAADHQERRALEADPR